MSLKKKTRARIEFMDITHVSLSNKEHENVTFLAFCVVCNHLLSQMLQFDSRKLTPSTFYEINLK